MHVIALNNTLSQDDLDSRVMDSSIHQAVPTSSLDANGSTGNGGGERAQKRLVIGMGPRRNILQEEKAVKVHDKPQFSVSIFTPSLQEPAPNYS